MARVTVEDCVENIPNRFELVALAAQRAKQISSGNPITVDRDNDKDAVVSLREIADQTVDFEGLRGEIVEGYCRYQRPDVLENDNPALEHAHIHDHNIREVMAEETESTDADLEMQDEGFADEEAIDFGDEEVDADD